MSISLGIDPGVTHVAYAIGTPQAVLRCGMIKIDANKIRPGLRARAMCDLLRRADDCLLWYGSRADVTAIENGDPNQKRMTRPENIRDLALIAGACTQWANGSLFVPTAAKWKGPIEKAQHHIQVPKFYPGWGVASRRDGGRATQVPAEVEIYHLLDGEVKFSTTDWKDILDAILLMRWGLQQLARADNLPRA